MKQFLLSIVLLGAVLIQPVPSGAFERGNLPAAVVDMPKVIDMSYASPDTWHALPPSIYVYEKTPVLLLEPNELDLPTSPTKLAVLH